MLNLKTYCATCGESGTVTIWHPSTIMSLKRGDDPVVMREAAVACHCKVGTKYTSRIRRGDVVSWLQRFRDQWWHVQRTIQDRNENGSIFNPAADVAAQMSPKLKSFLSGKLPNHVDAFDEFNAEGCPDV